MSAHPSHCFWIDASQGCSPADVDSNPQLPSTCTVFPLASWTMCWWQSVQFFHKVNEYLTPVIPSAYSMWPKNVLVWFLSNKAIPISQYDAVCVTNNNVQKNSVNASSHVVVRLISNIHTHKHRIQKTVCALGSSLIYRWKGMTVWRFPSRSVTSYNSSTTRQSITQHLFYIQWHKVSGRHFSTK